MLEPSVAIPCGGASSESQSPRPSAVGHEGVPGLHTEWRYLPFAPSVTIPFRTYSPGFTNLPHWSLRSHSSLNAHLSRQSLFSNVRTSLPSLSNTPSETAPALGMLISTLFAGGCARLSRPKNVNLFPGAFHHGWNVILHSSPPFGFAPKTPHGIANSITYPLSAFPNANVAPRSSKFRSAGLRVSTVSAGPVGESHAQNDLLAIPLGDTLNWIASPPPKPAPLSACAEFFRLPSECETIAATYRNFSSNAVANSVAYRSPSISGRSAALRKPSRFQSLRSPSTFRRPFAHPISEKSRMFESSTGRDAAFAAPKRTLPHMSGRGKCGWNLNTGFAVSADIDVCMLCRRTSHGIFRIASVFRPSHSRSNAQVMSPGIPPSGRNLFQEMNDRPSFMGDATTAFSDFSMTSPPTARDCPRTVTESPSPFHESATSAVSPSNADGSIFSPAATAFRSVWSASFTAQIEHTFFGVSELIT